MNLFQPDRPSSPTSSGGSSLRPRRSLWRRAALLAAGIFLLWLSLNLLPHSASAEEADEREAATPFMTGEASPGGMTSTGLIRPGTVAVFLLLAAGGALAIYLHRRRPDQTTAGGLIEVVSNTPLSDTQRLLLVRCGDETLLLGVTPQHIEVLKEFPEDGFAQALDSAASEAVAPAGTTFAALLQHAGFTARNGHSHAV